MPANEKGVDVGHWVQPLVPSLEVPVYPKAHNVHTEVALPTVAVLFVLYPPAQAMHPDKVFPSLE